MLFSASHINRQVNIFAALVNAVHNDSTVGVVGFEGKWNMWLVQ